MRDNKLRYHFMAEVQRDGFDKFAQRIFDELKGKKCPSSEFLGQLSV